MIHGGEPLVISLLTQCWLGIAGRCCSAPPPVDAAPTADSRRAMPSNRAASALAA